MNDYDCKVNTFVSTTQGRNSTLPDTPEGCPSAPPAIAPLFSRSLPPEVIPTFTEMTFLVSRWQFSLVCFFLFVFLTTSVSICSPVCLAVFPAIYLLKSLGCLSHGFPQGRFYWPRGHGAVQHGPLSFLHIGSWVQRLDEPEIWSLWQKNRRLGALLRKAPCWQQLMLSAKIC